jgi:hypothetical protein
MFSEHLFTHKYDIDDIISSLCGNGPTWLNTTNGEVSSTKPTGPESHIFAMEPLPALYLQEIKNSQEQTHLSEVEKTEIQAILATATIQQLPSYFEEGRTGGWLRERIKDAALEWLDTHDLIPPSMRHINRTKAAKLYESRTVKIEDIN